MLADPALNMVLLDEITYMVAYDYLPLEAVLDALKNRPAHQTVIVTGRGCHRDILELADTVSECVRLNMRSMQESKRKLALITKKSPVT
jgi:cob(I)alamin adenosyltransferase